jgi:glycosyltransferase involved in cell wall biosynthesis
MVLLHFLRWLKQNTRIPFIILLKRDGELREEFEALAPTYVYLLPYVPLVGIKGRLLGNWNTYIGVPHYYRKLKKALQSHSVSLIYANSMGNGSLLHFLAFLNCKTITHVHELEYGFYFNGPENNRYLLQYTHHYIAAAEAVKANLVKRHGVDAKKIDVVHEFVPTAVQPPAKERSVKEELGIPEEAFVVGTSGTMDLRKGFDLLVPLAKEIYRQTEAHPIYFVWIGGSPESDNCFVVKDDAEKAGMNAFIRIPGAKKDPLAYFSAFDVFVLLSREDPFPLVCLEASLLGKPLVCFEGAGGMPEFVEEDCGFVVPYLNIAGMAEKVILLCQDPVLRTKLGNNAREKVLERHGVATAAPQILSLLKRVDVSL